MKLQRLNQDNTHQNNILDALPLAEREYLNQYLELVLLPVGKMLYEFGDKAKHVYFPINCMVSLFYVLEDGGSSETASIGNEGIFNPSFMMGGAHLARLAMVQIAGYAYKLDTSVLRQAFDRSQTMQHLLLCYTQTLLTFIAISPVCNSHHNIKQQLCRWLLLALDRSPASEMTFTHQLVANMLGVRREGITETAYILKQEGLISYRRGHITVIKRKELEQHACECYAVIRKELDRCY